jgi:hypothetical protein
MPVGSPLALVIIARYAGVPAQDTRSTRMLLDTRLALAGDVETEHRLLNRDAGTWSPGAQAGVVLVRPLEVVVEELFEVAVQDGQRCPGCVVAGEGVRGEPVGERDEQVCLPLRGGHFGLCQLVSQIAWPWA